MRARRLLLTPSMLLATACAVPVFVPPEVPPAREALGGSGMEAAQPAAEERPVLQAVPPAGEVRWGGGGGVFAVTGRVCEASLVDAASARVTARLGACRIWPSPVRDVFLAQMEDRSLVAWDGGGAQLGTVTPELAYDRAPAWSPDGTRIALASDDLLRVVTAAGSEPARVAAIPTRMRLSGGAGYEPSWRADGALVAVHDRKEVWTVSVPAGGAGALSVKAVPTGCVTVQQVKFAPRGDGLAVRCDEDYSELWDTRAERLVLGTHRVRDWSATGRHVTVLAPALEVHDATTDAVEVRPRAAGYEPLRYSPDDAWLANADLEGATPSVEVWSVATGQRVLRLPGVTDPEWSADGAFLSARSLDGKAPGLLVVAAGSWSDVWRGPSGARGRWSTAGARLAVTSPASGLELLDARTATSRPLPLATAEWVARLYQAPDGALIAPLVARPEGPARAIRVEPDGAASVVDVPGGAVDPGSSPDGARTLSSVRQSGMMMAAGWRLFVDDPATKEHVFLDHGYGGYDARWSARGHRLLVVHGGALFFDTDARRVWRVPVTSAQFAALDGGGTRAVLMTPEGLQVVTLASNEAPVLLEPPSHPPPVLLALTGSRLAAVTREGEVTVWDVTTRERVASWSAGLSPEQVAWVGDGERLAFSRREELRLVRPDGTDGVTLTALRSGDVDRVVSQPPRRP